VAASRHLKLHDAVERTDFAHTDNGARNEPNLPPAREPRGVLVIDLADLGADAAG
jgi:hypothetical protein